MIRKIIILCFIIVVFQRNALPSDFNGMPWVFNQTIGLQVAYSNEPLYTFAYQGCIVFATYGYLYQLNVGSKLYVGLTPATIIGELLSLPIDLRLQYGRSLAEKNNLLRISADYYFFYRGAPFILNTFSTVGVFVEKNFGNNTPLNGFSFGVSLNWSLWDIFWIKNERKKYFHRGSP